MDESKVFPSINSQKLLNPATAAAQPSHEEVLEKLLNQIKPIDYYEKAGFHLLDMSNWRLGKLCLNHSFICLCVGEAIKLDVFGTYSGKCLSRGRFYPFIKENN